MSESLVEISGEIYDIDAYSGRGRPLFLTKELADIIINAIRVGNYLHIAAEMAGVSGGTFSNWLLRGSLALNKANGVGRRDKKMVRLKKNDAPYAYLAMGVRQAMSQAEATMVAGIRKSGMGSPALVDDQGNVVQRERTANWTALAWLLERRYKERWGEKVEVSGEIDVHVGADLKKLRQVAEEVRSWEELQGIKEPINVEFSENGQ